MTYDRDTCTNDGVSLRLCSSTMTKANRTQPAPRMGDYSTLFNSYSNVLLSYCAMQDPVCCKNGTMFAAHLSYFTQENAQEVAAFVKKNYDAACA